MGNCCALVQAEKLDPKEENLDIKKPSREEALEEKGNHQNLNTAENDWEAEFSSSANNFLSHNEDVNVFFLEINIKNIENIKNK